MKNLNKQVAALVVLCAALQVNAMEMTPEMEKRSSVLTLLNVKKGNRLMIKDASGNIYYQENIRDAREFLDRFSLTFLPEGKYLLELDRESETMVYPIEISTKKVSINPKTGYVIPASNDFLAKPKKSNPNSHGLQQRYMSYKGGEFSDYINRNKKNK